MRTLQMQHEQTSKDTMSKDGKRNKKDHYWLKIGTY